MEDGGMAGRGPAPLALAAPMGAPGAPEPGAEELDCAAGLLAGRGGGVDIRFCYRGQDTEVRLQKLSEDTCSFQLTNQSAE